MDKIIRKTSTLKGNSKPHTVRMKMREATSKDPWGASSTLMSEIADYTYESNLLDIIMAKVWKIFTEENKNWHRINKTLILLTYIILTGSQYVATRCIENLNSIEVLISPANQDKASEEGFNITAKVNYLSLILKNAERLMDARSKAINTRNAVSGSGSRRTSVLCERTPKFSVPSSVEEETQQVEQALAMSLMEAKKMEDSMAEEKEMLEKALAASKAEFETKNSIFDLTDAVVVTQNDVGKQNESFNPWSDQAGSFESSNWPLAIEENKESIQQNDPWGFDPFIPQKSIAPSEPVARPPPYEALINAQSSGNVLGCSVPNPQRNIFEYNSYYGQAVQPQTPRESGNQR